MKETSDLTDISGLENLYAINRQGYVWSYPSCWIVRNGGLQVRPGRFLTQTLDNTGYYMVMLGKGRKRCSIHRLLAQTFIPNPQNLSQVNHKNGIKVDNRLENLEWCTAQENIQHSHKLELSPKGEALWSTKLNPVSVRDIRNNYQALSQRKLAKMFGVGATTIARIIKLKSWKHI